MTERYEYSRGDPSNESFPGIITLCVGISFLTYRTLSQKIKRYFFFVWDQLEKSHLGSLNQTLNKQPKRMSDRENTLYKHLHSRISHLILKNFSQWV